MASVKKTVENVAKHVGKTGSKVVKTSKKAVMGVGKTGYKFATKSKDAVVNALDQNGDGHVDSADIIMMALKVPGVKVDREKFLRKEFKRYCKKSQIEIAIAENPATAQIDSGLINKIADEVIKFERNAVSGISMALGMPGGVAAAATIPVDIVQYYGYMLRAAQKLMYLYGFPELDIRGDIDLDSETLNNLTICLGVMYGVAGANKAIKAMAKALSVGVEKKLLSMALTKGTIYPIVKEIAKWFGKRMTKEIFAGFFKKAIPVAGGIIGGGLTYATFKPCCYKLKNTLQDTALSNINHVETAEEERIYNDIIDMDVKDIIVDYNEEDDEIEISEDDD